MTKPISLLAFPLLLIYAIGVIMIFDASSGEIVDCAGRKNQFSALFRQLLWGILAIAAFMTAWAVGWKRLLKLSPTIYALLVIALVLVLIPGIGMCSNGSRRWLGLGGIHIQPSEFVKIILPAFFIHTYAKYANAPLSFLSFLLIIGQPGISVLLIMLEPNNATAGILILLIALLIMLTEIPLRFWLLPLCLGSIGLVSFATHNGYVQKRFEGYMHPEQDIRGKGHQPYQAKIAAGSGGIFGKGPAKSIQKLSYLPEAQNDYIVAIFAEEYGFIGMCALIGLYMWLCMEIRKILASTPSELAFNWGMAIYFLLCIQTCMNLGIVSGMLPSSGLNLPFFSQGGSSLIANAFGLGCVTSMREA